MPAIIRNFILVLGLLCLLQCSDTAPAAAPENADETLFTLLSATATGINFENRLTEGPNTNILVYEYFYNGGGVAAGDLNGDGKTDLYFTANMAENKLYLNDGALKFSDATAASNAGGRPGPWKTGVTVADVNADGKLDIYLCYSGALPAEKRANQLLINQGNDANGVPLFKDEASAYGLASTAFSNQMYFFDYDQDGDLDGLLLNHNPKSLPVLNVAKTKEMLQQADPQRGLTLYRNDGGKFKDVTTAAGISGSALSYGLGLAISDLDRDGDPDFYVSNDYEVPDFLYYNNGDGTFTDRLGNQMGHTSHFSMGNDIGDINNDGHPDIFTLDMLPADNRRQKLLMPDDNRSKLDLNLESGFHHQTMRNMLQLNQGNGSFAEIGRLAGVAMTDWSWSALFADFDNDGWQDLHVTNGYLKDYTNMDFISFMEDYVAKKGRLQRADLRGILEEMPASDVNNYAFGNQGDKTFADQTKAWGLARPSNSNGAVYADLDDDGDLDLVVNNVDQQAFVYRNNSQDQHYLSVVLEGGKGNTFGVGTRVEVTAENVTQSREMYSNRGYLSSVDPVLHFGLGARTQVQRVVVTWPDGSVQTLEDIAVDQRLVFRQDAASKGGMDKEIKEGTAFVEVTSPLPYVDQLSGKRDFDAEPLLLREYSHFGPAITDEGQLVARNNKVLAYTSGEPIVSFLGNSYVEGKYPQADDVTIRIDGGTPLKLPNNLENVSKINAAIWSDLNRDGNKELIIAGEWTPLLVYSLDGESLVDVTKTYFSTDHHGWWTALHLSDLNGDGQPDIVAGNQGLNNLFTASKERPVELHAADLDDNGSIDPVLSYYAPDGKRYPDATKDELLKQLAGLKRRYVSYASYADQTLEEVFPEWPQETIHLTADRLETTLYLSQPDGTYLASPLPLEAQYAPVHTITELDYNSDGHADLLLCGNDNMEKQRWGKSDANSGVLLQGDGKGGFVYVPQTKSGFNLRGDVRNVVMVEDLLLFGIRGGKAVTYKQQRTNLK
ncbi:VCBS repeat-containing protein [Neolewinella persica]|uniref:VCBS repeat-containing protein n=1 Tax=Neolewinella persica TaxID=70998 RepID=UPI000374C961|nr:VCBS repeat-containing protein [Neolewinella persica]